jgi:hypothetical protein
MSQYEKQLEEANESLQRRVEELEIRLSWEEKTKDLRNLANEYHRMDKEIFSVNKNKLVNSILSLDNNSIISMWSNGYRISTRCSDILDDNDIDFGFFPRKRHSVTIVGPYRNGDVGYDSDKFFGIVLSVRRSFFRPFISDKCFIIMEHNRVCDFSGAIAESVHSIDSIRSKDIFNLIKRVNICKCMMNGKLCNQDCFIKLDTFRNSWADMPEITG